MKHHRPLVAFPLVVKRAFQDCVLRENFPPWSPPRDARESERFIRNFDETLRRGSRPQTKIRAFLRRDVAVQDSETTVKMSYENKGILSTSEPTTFRRDATTNVELAPRSLFHMHVRAPEYALILRFNIAIKCRIRCSAV